MNKEKLFKEGAFQTMEDVERHIERAASLRAGMQKTLSITKKQEPKTLTAEEVVARALLLKEKKFEHKQKMEEAYLEIAKQQLHLQKSQQAVYNTNIPVWSTECSA